MVYGSLGTIVVLTAGVGATVFGAWMLYREARMLFSKRKPFMNPVLGASYGYEARYEYTDVKGVKHTAKCNVPLNALKFGKNQERVDLPEMSSCEIGSTDKLVAFFEAEKPNKKVPQLWMSKMGETVIIIYPDKSYSFHEASCNEWREYRHYKLDVKKLTRYEFISNIE